MSEVEDQEALDNAPDPQVDDTPYRDMERAELYISTIRLIDAVTERGSVKGGELLAVGAIRQKYVEWLVDNGFVNQEQPA